MARTANTEGALLELIARGEKDKFFFKDDESSENPFNWEYLRYPATIPEVRRTVPLNAPSFGGQRIEWEFDLPGDILTDVSIVVELPSWIPPAIQKVNKKGSIYVQGTGGSPNVTYGYVNGIGYFLFKKIELYQDTFLLQEFTGDSLFLSERGSGSWNSGFLNDTLKGIHDGSPISIQRNATPERISVRLPILGCNQQGQSAGLPLCALRGQTLRLRVWLRSFSELIETSNGLTQPSPLNKTFKYQTVSGGPILSFTTGSLETLGKPVLTLETKQLYVSNEIRKFLAKQTYSIPFPRFYENNFTITAYDYMKIRTILTPTFIKRILDANFSVEQLIIAFRSGISIRSNQLWNLTNNVSGTPSVYGSGSDTGFYSDLQLIIAGKTREEPYGPVLWSSIVADAKNERSVSRSMNYLNWTLGYQSQASSPAYKEPMGSINFSTANKPTLSLVPIDTALDPVLNQKQTEIICLAESWGLYVIQDGRGSLAFAN